jgi:phosphate transport system protein
MLGQSLDGLMKMNADLARKVRASDDEVDEINRQMYLKIGQAVCKNPEHVERLLSYLSASRHLERIADYATNIAEDVIYLIEGEIVRHKPTFPEA